MEAQKYDAFSLKKVGKKLERGKKLHTSFLTKDQAQVLNEQKANTLVEYALVKTKVESEKAKK